MFSWSSGSRTTPYPGSRVASSSSPVVAQTISGSIRPPEYTRAQHIESYLQDDALKRSTRRVSADDSTYDTVFQTTRGDTLIVRVHLPVSGSRQVRAPAMTMAGVKARHPWLDSRMRITGYAPIETDDKWRSSRMLLGQAVHEVVKHMQLEPPEVLEITDPGLQAIQSNKERNGSKNSIISSATGTSNSVVQRGSAQAINHDAPPEYASVLLDMPDIPRQFPELDSLSREDLDDLLEDELEFQAFVNQLPTFHSIQSTAEDILCKNADMAADNLGKEETLKSLHEDVSQLKITLEKKIEVFRKLEKDQDSICAPPDLNDVFSQLTKGKKEAFQESEALAEVWVEDGDNVDGFVQDFIKKRRIHHLRAAKIERMQKGNSKLV